MKASLITDSVLNIGAGHPLDLVRTKNITDTVYTTLWEKQPFTVEAGEERPLLRYIATKFARELVTEIINKKVAQTGKSIIDFASERIPLLNQILLSVEQPYIQIPVGQQPPQPAIQEAPLAPGEVPVDLGRATVLQELGVSEGKVTSSPKDVAANIKTIAPEPASPRAVHKEKEKLSKRAKELGIKVEPNWSLDKIKEAILYGQAK